MSNVPIVVKGANLSQAWVEILELLLDNKGELSPLVLTLTGFDENKTIKQLVSENLHEKEMPSIETVSETIFPASLYEYVGYDRHMLYTRYKKNLKRIKKISSSNRNGTYFSRLIAFGEESKLVNQLEIIISGLNDERNVRRSKLQAGIFDPGADHSDSWMQGFPCLQHVTFFKTKDGGIVLNSFYAIQFFFKRAYGNWLGLINLGKFIANETGLKLERFNCFIGAEVLDNIKRSEARKLLSHLKNELNKIKATNTLVN